MNSTPPCACSSRPAVTPLSFSTPSSTSSALPSVTAPADRLTIGPEDGGPGQVIYLDGAKVAVVDGAPVDLADIRLVTA